jgi:peptide/nickel transport system substrate-binding protein
MDAPVKFMFERIKSPKLKSRQARYFRMLDRVEVVDDYTARLHFNAFDAMFVRKLASGAWAMLAPPKYYGKHPNSYLATHPVGSGPYKFVKWVKDQVMILDANEDYWRGAPKIKRIVWRPMPEEGTRVAALMKGELDIIRAVPHHLIPKIKADPNLKVDIIPAVRIMYLSFVTHKGGPLANVKVRQAMNYAIDTEAIAKTIMGGLVSPTGQLFHPWTEGYRPGLPRWYPYNPKKAKELLKEAGYPNGFSIRLISPTGRYPKDVETGHAISGQLAQVGIKVQYTPLSFSSWVRTWRSHKRPDVKPFLNYMGFGNGGGISDSLLSATIGSGGAWSAIRDKEIDAAVDRAASTTDDTERDEAYAKINDLMKEKATHVLMFRLHDVYAYNKRVHYKFRPDERMWLWQGGYLSE